MRLYEFQLPKNKWMADISNSAKQEVSGDLVDLVKTAYSKTPLGSFVNSIKDVIPSDWAVLDFDKDPDVDSCVFYRSSRKGETWQGNKIQGIGHDGSSESKKKAIAKVVEYLNKPGWWIESSDAMRAVLNKMNVNAVTDVDVLKKLFNDPSLTMISKDTYKRTLSNGEEITETVFGNPKVF